MGISNKNPVISVIIPTYNRGELLKHSLESLADQTLSKDIYEVVVINDGSEDNTDEVCKYYSGLINLIYAYQENSGISSAKNLGIFLSRGPVILFFDDDDVADRDLLKQHLKFHIRYPMENVACLGYTTWHPEIYVTPLMRYITEIGQFLFSYITLKDGQELDFTYFWGGRTSCKRSLLVKHGIFNQDFRYIIEDIELGYRLSRFGLRVIFNKRAKSFMIRPITFDQFCLRCERQGRALEFFSRLHKDPSVQSYCMVSEAEEKWKTIHREIEETVKTVKEIESLLASETLTANEKGSLTNILFELYRKSFCAFKFKGIVEAKSELESSSSDHDKTKKLSEKDISVFTKKWQTNSPFSNFTKRVLVIDYFLPMFDRASGSLRLFNILKIIKKLWYHVTFIAMNNDSEERYRPILEDLGIKTYTIRNFSKNNAFDMEGFSMFFKERRFDYTIIEFWSLARDWIPFFRNLSRKMQIIVDSVDIHFIREIREAELAMDKDLMKKALLNKEQEILTYRNADRVWVVTENDREAIREYTGKIPIDVIPNVHEKIDFSKVFEDTQDILFVGNFNHPPNRDAAFFLCNEVFPLIKKGLKDVKLFIVGNGPQEDIRSLASDDIIITGYVEDLSPYLKKARISVAPLRYGAGMKGKIGEALSWGLPVVTTSIGAEGMGLTDGTHVLIADDPMEFADKVIRLYNDRELWNRLKENGKNYINENFSPDAVKKSIEKVFLEDYPESTDHRTRENNFSYEERINFLEPNFKEATISIIIPVKDNWEYTKVCLDSILRYTDMPYEIVIVDNGSEKPIYRSLLKWREKNPKILLRYLKVNKNKGFAGGCNEGANLATGDYLVFLNNDTVVTPNWLKNLIKPLSGDDTIGITGPLSNYVNGRQRIIDCPISFKSPEQVNFGRLVSYASDIARKNENRYMFTEVIMGLCLAIKTEVFDNLGGFDERFYPGNFEDSDLSMRIHMMGLKPLICMDTFVYHFGNKTFDKEQNGYRMIYENNLKSFREKWDIRDHLDEESMYHKILGTRATSTVNIICDALDRIRHLVSSFKAKTVIEIINYYLKERIYSRMPLIIVSDGEEVKRIEKILQENYPEKQLEEKGDITLFAGETKELIKSMEEDRRFFLFTWRDKMEEDLLKSEMFFVI